MGYYVVIWKIIIVNVTVWKVIWFYKNSPLFSRYRKIACNFKQDYVRTVQRNIMVRSCNHFGSGNAAVPSVCIVEPHVTVNNIKLIIKSCTPVLIWPIFLAGIQNTYRCVNVTFPIFCSIVTKFGLSRQTFIKGPNIKFHGNPSSRCRADACRQTEGNSRFSRLMRTRLK